MHHDETHRDEERPNRESNMEPAEGSRENTNIDDEQAGNQGGRGTSTMHRQREGQERGGASELPAESFGEGEHGGGISNRPLEEEQERQQNLPPRGERRENWKED